MFCKRFAFQSAFAGGPWQRGRGHWWPGSGRGGPHRWHMHRKPFGRGGPFGGGRHGGPFGEGRGGRFFGRGDLKYVLLELLQARPMHGYEMMKAVQERTSGMYTPSPGSVYPTLQMLEDRGFVTVSEVEGKKVYQITDAGRAFLSENQPEAHGAAGGPGFWRAQEEEWAEVAAFWQAAREIGPLFGRALHQARHDPKKLKRLHKLLAKIRSELADMADDMEDEML